MMEQTKLNQLLEVAKEAAVKAGETILEIYHNEDFNVEMKGDNSPLTKADKQAHQEIVAFLEKTDLPILSEEGKDIPFEERKNWEYFWMVDPLDGTKEFIKRNGEFTVNIALIHKGSSVMGVVYTPVLKKLYFGGKGIGAFLQEDGQQAKELPVRQAADLSKAGLKVVASRSHLNEDTEKFMQSLKEPEIVSMGSSLKFMLIAEGNADVYPRFAPTMEWDTAAAHAIVNAVGYKVNRHKEETEISYNKENLLNPYFLVR